MGIDCGSGGRMGRGGQRGKNWDICNKITKNRKKLTNFTPINAIKKPDRLIFLLTCIIKLGNRFNSGSTLLFVIAKHSSTFLLSLPLC